MCFMLVNIIQSKIIGLEYTSYITYHFKYKQAYLGQIHPNLSKSMLSHTLFHLRNQIPQIYRIQIIPMLSRTWKIRGKTNLLIRNSNPSPLTRRKRRKSQIRSFGQRILASLSFSFLSFSFSLFFFPLSLSKISLSLSRTQEAREWAREGSLDPSTHFSTYLQARKYLKNIPG